MFFIKSGVKWGKVGNISLSLPVEKLNDGDVCLWLDISLL